MSEQPSSIPTFKGDKKWLNKDYLLPETMRTIRLGTSSFLMMYQINPAKLSPREKCNGGNNKCPNQPSVVVHFKWHDGSQSIDALCDHHGEEVKHKWE